MGDRLGIPGAVGFLDSLSLSSILSIVSCFWDPGLRTVQPLPFPTPHTSHLTPHTRERASSLVLSGAPRHSPSPLAPGALRAGTHPDTTPPCRAGRLAGWLAGQGMGEPVSMCTTPGRASDTYPSYHDPAPPRGSHLAQAARGVTRRHLHPSPSPSPREECPTNPDTTCLSTRPREV